MYRLSWQGSDSACKPVLPTELESASHSSCFLASVVDFGDQIAGSKECLRQHADVGSWFPC